MYRILLACAAGMSTSIVVSKMKKYADSIGEETEILAMPANAALNCLNDGWQIVLLGPQVKFLESQFKDASKKSGTNIPVGIIKFQDYGMADGEAIYKSAKKILEGK